jgi:small subunit ribosomal protein S2
LEIPTIQQLLDLGAHFGHKKERTYPAARQFTYLLRDGIYIINLEETQKRLKTALEFLTKVASQGKVILMVGTKRQAKEIIQKVAQDCSLAYITHRWLGGTLTNFETIQKNIKNFKELKDFVKSDQFKDLIKKERIKIEEKLTKMTISLEGIENLRGLPDLLIIVDPFEERIAVQEAIKMNIPIVALLDTNANPDLINYPIPANDDAQKTVEMIVGLMGQAIKEGLSKIKVEPQKENKDSHDQKG